MKPKTNYDVRQAYTPVEPVQQEERIMPESLSRLLKTALPDFDIPFTKSNEMLQKILRRIDEE